MKERFVYPTELACRPLSEEDIKRRKSFTCEIYKNATYQTTEESRKVSVLDIQTIFVNMAFGC